MLRKIDLLSKAAIRELSFKQKGIEVAGKMVRKHPFKTTTGTLALTYGLGILTGKIRQISIKWSTN